MGETIKARDRRIREHWFKLFAPEDQPGIDIGCQRDPLNHTFRRWDLIFGDGDATHMEGVPDEIFQTVYASHVLEHLQDPVTAIRNWYRICRPGGHVIICVPHRDLYEKRLTLPSRWNNDHKWFYLPDEFDPPHTQSLRAMIEQAIPKPDIVGLTVQQEGWLSLPEDQHSVGEYSIEAIVRKRYHSPNAWDIPYERRGPLLLVAAGPSSDHVEQYLDLGEIAAVNEVIRRIPDRNVKWLISLDLEALLNVHNEWPRAERFLVSSELFVNAGPSDVKPDSIPDFPVERWTSFPLLPWAITDEQVVDWIANDTRSAHRNAATAALHLFARMGYSPIYMLGHDGGLGYGAKYAELTPEASPQRDFRDLRARLELIARCVAEKFGTDVRFWPDF